MEITGAELFVRALRAEGVSTLFAYPGGQVIDLFNALYGAEGIDMILPRHEQGLVHAADGYARSTGRVGVCLVTSGPGATNLVTGIATANYDSVPLVCFTGQVPTHLIGNAAFQEVDIVNITRSICKYALTVRRREDLSAVIKKAFEIAVTGRPGPVVVDLPKDIQQARGSAEYPAHAAVRPRPPLQYSQLRRAMERLQKAERPLFLIGGGARIAGAHAELREVVESTGVPVVTTIMGRGALPTGHPLYVGNLGIHGSAAANTAVSRCDVLFSIGVRFNDRITGKPGTFAPGAAIVRVDIDPAVISRNVTADIPIVADAREALAAMGTLAEPLDTAAWTAQISRWKAAHPLATPGEGLTPQRILEAVNRVFPRGFFVTDVGQNQLWATQFLELDEHRQLLTSGGLGTMGYGLPAALGAQIGNPDADVVVITGDGGMQMNAQELATAAVYGLPVVVCILNNGYLGNVRQWQELFFDRRYAATCLRRRKTCPAVCDAPGPDCPPYIPDFVALAHSFGAHALRVTRPEEVEPALLRAKRAKDAPTVIEFLIPPEANVLPIVPPGQALDQMVIQGKSK